MTDKPSDRALAQAFRETALRTTMDSYEFANRVNERARELDEDQTICGNCGGWGMVGGPSYAKPDEGGVPCPDCNLPTLQQQP